MTTSAGKVPFLCIEDFNGAIQPVFSHARDARQRNMLKVLLEILSLNHATKPPRNVSFGVLAIFGAKQPIGSRATTGMAFSIADPQKHAKTRPWPG